MGVRTIGVIAVLVFTPLVAFTSDARADDYGLPVPRLVPELSLSKDKGVESAPAADSWSTKKKAVSLFGAGPGTPLGVVGATFEYAPIKYVVLGAGGGFAPDGGLRGSFMPRLRLPLGRLFAIGLGFPFTMGPYEYSVHQQEQCVGEGCAVAFRTTRSWSIAAWGQVEPNVEIRVGPGVALRLFGGVAQILNDSDRCTSTLYHGCPSNIGERKFYGGLAAGYAW